MVTCVELFLCTTSLSPKEVRNVQKWQNIIKISSQIKEVHNKFAGTMKYFIPGAHNTWAEIPTLTPTLVCQLKGSECQKGALKTHI